MLFVVVTGDQWLSTLFMGYWFLWLVVMQLAIMVIINGYYQLMIVAGDYQVTLHQLSNSQQSTN